MNHLSSVCLLTAYLVSVYQVSDYGLSTTRFMSPTVHCLSQEPYINRSSPRIEEDFSLHRTYIVFRTLGLRHLTVVDMANRAVGIITRKDLMGFNLEEKLEQRKRRGYSITGGVLKLLPSEQKMRRMSGKSVDSNGRVDAV